MKLNLSFITSLVLFSSLMFYGCPRVDQAEIDEQEILDYMAENNIDGQPTGSGLYVEILETGFGVFPDTNSSVQVLYKGYLLDGTVFDQADTTTGPATFRVGDLIQGWEEGMQLMRKDGKAIFLIPSELGYGKEKQTDIPKNSVLVFEVELVDIL